MSAHYHTQHAPMGAFASFTIGLPQSRGGMGQSLSGPADQDVFAGYRKLGGEGAADEKWQLLPFYIEPDVPAAAAYTSEFAEEGAADEDAPVMLDADEVKRELRWASDIWSHDGFELKIYSPFGRTESPETLSEEVARLAFAPVVQLEVGFDNRTSSKAVELVFGLGHAAHQLRPLEDTAPDLAGFALGRGMGFAADPEMIDRRLQALSIFYPKACTDHRGLHLLGPEGAVVFRVGAGEQASFPVSLGFYQSGVMTTGLTASYYYTKLFDDLESVLRHGLAQHAYYREQAENRDAELARADWLNADQKWLIAQATHSYWGSTELLWDETEKKPLWVVNEGEYRMINTFDLTIDHVFFELDWQPWVVKNTLDLFVERYSFRDSLNVPEGIDTDGGISFVHDMGVMDQFTLPGTSCYECGQITGCFSQMTMEQLINWVCCAGTYVLATEDREWLQAKRATFIACAESLLRRDHPDADLRTGLLKFDSDRCGPDGAEITTYDSLDVSLGQARNNLYISVKAYAAWSLLEKVFAEAALGETEWQAQAVAATDRAAGAIAAKFETDCGMFPAVFEDGNRSRILPAVEGLVFPHYLGLVDGLKTRHAELFDKLGQHMQNVLQRGVCLDAKTGAWKISSTSKNSWFSKIAISQHVLRSVFPGLEVASEAGAPADAVHARMQQTAVIGQYAMVDQVNVTDVVSMGSRYYPRIVTSCLWLREGK
ncbi:glycoside hydrolase family 52 protein [Puniceicoccus vermicola]|uniref:Beta-xylosidase n=1 Tax=Puniceicoccus vermicola TaxID=388746 RepID=A0A7X1AXB6_9BACT|nr:glycoside hydrolase family 52 protein [Puniceicoccus vermicola]MBC2601733.1 beta-xylosidase [Puniceicoccus vermicola]